MHEAAEHLGDDLVSEIAAVVMEEQQDLRAGPDLDAQRDAELDERLSARRRGCAAGAASASASSAIVWLRNSCSTVSSRPRRRARETAWMLRIESPPSAKKLFLMPTDSTPRISAQISASACSVGVPGATYSTSTSTSGSAGAGAGSAARSSMPCALIGSASIRTKVAGIM